MKYTWILGLVLLILMGCMSKKLKPIADDPFYAPIYPDGQHANLRPTGSIFRPQQSNELYSDIRAHRVGDIITIKLIERTSATKTANNEMSKNSEGKTAAPLLYNAEYPSLAVTYNDAFKGSRGADADQSNSLSGDISVNITKVLNNGNLVVRGEKWITINQGEEFIRITGLIRPQDIETDNTITSLRVANARIEYSGTGTFADVQKMGWLSSFFMSEWWPF
jgi:flagellar L-ring protein FlgH